MADTDRIDRFTAFTKLPRAVPQDGRISYRARGLLAALWCDRPGWTWTIEHLARTRAPPSRATPPSPAPCGSYARPTPPGR
ncbi:hypothetical protein [Streptosporangium roseum]|uniref:hypothetical protein n=1 Tax=Streptosporangium roseum TaxID=2001 RepID=UPI0004CCB63A|nr:hypothetical protein [Streptosporangium roseum]